jgi:mevalonate kinase
VGTVGEQFFYGHGKVLLTGEYLVLDGAEALALPTSVGQTMSIKYRHSYEPKLYWKSYDQSGREWFSATFEYWHFDCADNTSDDAKNLQNILRQARKQNIHFLRDEMDIFVETRLEFNLAWGLGSSSSLLYNIAQWAYVSPFELQMKTLGGSGYDIACAQAMGPIIYQLPQSKLPKWESVDFNPIFKENLFFIYLGKKQSTLEAIENYRKLNIVDKEKLVQTVNRITRKILKTIDLTEFNELIFEHEQLMSSILGIEAIKQSRFNDYNLGEIKSLGAWGGDFALITTTDQTKAREYFLNRGIDVFISYDELILQTMLFQKEPFQNQPDHLPKNLMQ